jgi:hypothetical protein
VINDEQPGMIAELPAFEPAGIGFEAYVEATGHSELLIGPLEITLRSR